MVKARRLRKTTTKKPKETEELYIPGPTDLNVPPDNILEYMFCIFGTKGIGKTTLGSNWGGKGKTLVLMSEPRRKNLAIRMIQFRTHTAEEIMDGAPDSWAILKENTERFIEDTSIECLSFDSIDLFYLMAQHHVAAKNGVTNPSKAGKESSAIWIELRDEFSAYFDTLRETDMGILLLSHTKEREIESVDGSMMAQQAPSAPPACVQYIKSACDFAFMYGWRDNERVLTFRDPSNNIWTGCGTQDRFCQPDGKQILNLQVPNDPDGVYPLLEEAWNNNAWDQDTPEEDREEKGAKTSKKRRRRTA